MKEKSNFGAMIKEARIKKDISKDELAKNLEVSKNMITQWEKNIGKPSFSHLLLLSKELDLNIDDIIIGYKVDKKNKKESNEEIKKLIKKNIKYKRYFVVFSGIFVIMCLIFLQIILYKNGVVSSNANFIYLMLVLMMCFVTFEERLEKANLLEQKNKYKEYAWLLVLAFIFTIFLFIKCVYDI